MEKKFVKVSGAFLVVMSWILALLSLTALTLMILEMVIPNFAQGSWFIVAMGEFLLPLQILINPQSADAGVYIIICAVMLILSIMAIVFVKKTYRFGSHNKKVSMAISLIISFILFAYTAFSLVLLILNYELIAMTTSLLLYGLLGENPGLLASLVMIKFIVICAIVIISTILVFFVFLLNREKEQKHVDRQIFNVNFYSDEFEEQINTEKLDKKAVEKEEQAEVQKPKVKKQSQELINKIMQLNELKDNGQISDVEYTKLRQKAIKRYKA